MAAKAGQKVPAQARRIRDTEDQEQDSLVHVPSTDSHIVLLLSDDHPDSGARCVDPLIGAWTYSYTQIHVLKADVVIILELFFKILKNNENIS